MNKRMRELQDMIRQKAQQAQTLLNGDQKDVDKAADILDEVEALQKEFQTIERAEKAAKLGVPTEGEKAPGVLDAVKKFADAIRSRFKSMSEGVDADGGFTVPEDISTRVQKLREERFSLVRLVDVVPTSTDSGARTYQKRAQHKGLRRVGEGSKIPKTDKPQFSRLTYNIGKFAGFLPVTNELLKDSDANIVSTVVGWLADEGEATDNAEILAKVLYEKAPVAMTGLDDIKRAINVTLSAFANSAAVITNSNGLQYLDTLKDGDGRYLLSPNPSNPMETSLAIGTRKVRVIVIPNEVLPNIGWKKTADSTVTAGKVYFTLANGIYSPVAQPTAGDLSKYYEQDGTKIPVICGDLKEYMVKFDRQQTTLNQSDAASVTGFNAFEEDLTLFRAIMRADYQVKDETAVVLGAIAQA